MAVRTSLGRRIKSGVTARVQTVDIRKNNVPHYCSRLLVFYIVQHRRQCVTWPRPAAKFCGHAGQCRFIDINDHYAGIGRGGDNSATHHVVVGGLRQSTANTYQYNVNHNPGGKNQHQAYVHPLI